MKYQSRENDRTSLWCNICDRKGHMPRACKKLGEEKINGLASIDAERAKVRCFRCDSTTHIARDCPRVVKNERVACVRDSESANKKAETVDCVKLSEEESCKRCEYAAAVRVVNQVEKEANSSEMPFCQWKVGNHIVQMLRDSGCSFVIVKRKFVKDGKMTGEIRSMKQLLETTEKVPVACVTVNTPYLVGDTEAFCVNESLYNLVIGNVPEAQEPFRPDNEWEMEGAV